MNQSLLFLVKGPGAIRAEEGLPSLETFCGCIFINPLAEPACHNHCESVKRPEQIRVPLDNEFELKVCVILSKTFYH